MKMENLKVTGQRNFDNLKKVLCIGTISVDILCEVSEIVQLGQAICCSNFSKMLGGKGLNQTVAIRHGGLTPCLYAKVGNRDYDKICTLLKKRNIDTNGIRAIVGESNTGYIQLTPSGDTAIVGYSNAETAFSRVEVREILDRYSQGDWIYLQNEISDIQMIIQEAKQRGLNVALNPSPMNGVYEPVNLSQVDCLILNEMEAFRLTGAYGNAALMGLADKVQGIVVITLGPKGAISCKNGVTYEIPACPADCKNTLGAGDTFFGFFLAEYLKSENITRALTLASASAALVVERNGTAEVIPMLNEVEERLCTWFF